ncbi:MAG TPA: hypothetical protein VIY56_14935 [Vicinamibacterales bacterium]
MRIATSGWFGHAFHDAQLLASVLSKRVAAGSTHVVIDLVRIY